MNNGPRPKPFAEKETSYTMSTQTTTTIDDSTGAVKVAVFVNATPTGQPLPADAMHPFAGNTLAAGMQPALQALQAGTPTNGRTTNGAAAAQAVDVAHETVAAPVAAPVAPPPPVVQPETVPDDFTKPLRDFFPAGQFVTMEAMGALAMQNKTFARRVLVEVYRHQTTDEQNEKGTSHANELGFSKKHVRQGVAYVQRILSRTLIRDDEYHGQRDASGKLIGTPGLCDLAASYRKQAFMVMSQGVMSQAQLDASPRRGLPRTQRPMVQPSPDGAPRKRGRPAGSKNRSTLERQAAAAQTPAPVVAR